MTPSESMRAPRSEASGRPGSEATSERPVERLPEFTMRSPRGTLETGGALLPVDADNCLAVARERESIVVGLLPFDPDEAPRLAVPETYRWISRTDDHADVAPVARPTGSLGVDSQIYRDAVASAVRRIHDGQLEKVVLSRALELHYDDAPLDPAAVYANLMALNPTAYVFSVREESTGEYLMGASPELVVGVDQQQFSTRPLAGSASRATSTGPTEDAQAGEALMKSAKDRAEHATVVDDIAQRLGPISRELTVPPAPSLVGTPQLWHLGTHITGILGEGLSALDAARAIHPTPAICGTPRNAALHLIRELEPYDRGFYGGLVGWTDPDGNGEWALNLRSGRVGPRTATLCAGAGIVNGSTPGGEHHETAVKLSTFLAALGLTLNDLAELGQ